MKGVLLINLGSPENLEISSIKKYLKEFLSDEYVLDLPKILRNILVNFIIVPFRSPKTKEAYASIWTENLARAHSVASKMECAIICINDHHKNDPSSPWGGFKDSGIGRENGIEAYMQYTHTRSVVTNYSRKYDDWFSDKKSRYS